MAYSTTSFGNIYEYVTSNGTVIPQTSTIKENIIGAMRAIFNNANLDTTDETPMGRLIEALTLLFRDIVCVNAQNANMMCVSQATGAYLDFLGAIFGIQRETSPSRESDESYRAKILGSASRGSGFPASIRQALSELDFVTSICVLNNGGADPVVLPNETNGVVVDPHSVFIAVGYDVDQVDGQDDSNDEQQKVQKIAEKINKTISAGCGFTRTSEIGGLKSHTIGDTATGTSSTISFYKPVRKYIKVEATVYRAAYTGVDIQGDTTAIILAYLVTNATNHTITDGEISTAVGTENLGIVCKDVTIKTSTDGTTYSAVEELAIRPYEAIEFDYDSTTGTYSLKSPDSITITSI